MHNPTGIQMHRVAEDGTYEDMQLDLSLSDFGGVMPTAGDLIVDPGVPNHLDRQQVEHRTVWEVVARYFFPATDPDDPWPYLGVLVCKERPGQEHEAEIVTKH